MNLFKLIFSSKGSMGRAGYFLGLLVAWLVFLGACFAPLLFGLTNPNNANNLAGIAKLFSAALYVGGLIIFVVINLVIAIKRLRDLQWSFWFLPFFIVPFLVFQLIGISVPGKLSKLHNK